MAFLDFHKLFIWRTKIPPKRMPSLIHPEKAPSTMRQAPEDFCDYKYSGPAIEKIVGLQGIRYPVLVARLIRKHHSVTGVRVEEEMTASLKDLKRGHHPQTEEITAMLCRYFETNIQRSGKLSMPRQTQKKHLIETIS